MKPYIYFILFYLFLMLTQIKTTSEIRLSDPVTFSYDGAANGDNNMFYCKNCSNQVPPINVTNNDYACYRQILVNKKITNNTVGNWTPYKTFKDPVPQIKHASITIKTVKYLLYGTFSCSIIPNVAYAVISNITITSNPNLYHPASYGQIPLINTNSYNGTCCANCYFSNIAFEAPFNDISFNRGGVNYFSIASQLAGFDIDDDDEYSICLSKATLTFQYIEETNSDDWIVAIVILIICFVTVIAFGVVFYGIYRKRINRLENTYKSTSNILSFNGNSGEFNPLLDDEDDAEDLGNIVLTKKIGCGSFGNVYKGESDRFGSVAIKLMPVEKQEQDKLIQEFKREIKIMKKLRHPNILLFMGAAKQPPNICIIMEYMERGSLQDLLQDKDLDLSLDLRKQLLLGAARGMKYLHSSKPMVIHRDLKSHNLLVDKNWVCKVADFGLSRMIETDYSNQEDLTMVGTPCWTAPEILRHESYSEKCDVYSYGVVIWEAYTRKKPYKNLTAFQVVVAVVNSGLRPQIPENCPQNWRQLMQDCWDEHPDNRPTFSEIIQRIEDEL
eukprot:TRINITY_DN12086_c0_g1_i1.p1 TRINITY_DN12086_c0_g1~~TRINITY_DN12086_c0_g1_i1.p1  ORF type:complete len:557 (+),score=118.40 TRINITY_DN12086_c0_g1_i1:74-1744(+)